MRVLVGVGTPEPNEDGVGVAVDDLVVPVFHEFARELHHLVATKGNGGHQLGIEETAVGRTQHAGEGIHEQLQGLGQRLVLRSLGFVPGAPERGHDFRQAVLFAREDSSCGPLTSVAASPAFEPSMKPTGSTRKVRMIEG